MLAHFTVFETDGHRCDLHYDIHAFDNFPELCVIRLMIKGFGISSCADEELAAVGIGA